MSGRAAAVEATLRTVVLRYFCCLDAEDWDGMADIWCEDGQLRAVGARPRNDRDAVIGYFGKLFTPWVEHADRPTRLLICEREEAVVAEVTFIGTTRDGREVSFDAIDVFDLRAGRIARLTNWYDIDYARRALAPAGDARVG
jgi:ketosteroid isomerase-like protein